MHKWMHAQMLFFFPKIQPLQKNGNSNNNKEQKRKNAYTQLKISFADITDNFLQL